MKKCKGCGQTKAETEYYKRLGKPAPKCKECEKVDRRHHYDQHLRAPAAPGGHPCRECGEPVPAKRIGGRPRIFCSRPCAVASNARDNKGRARGYILARYGITEADYVRMLASQGGRCAICRTDDPATKNGSWHVDHCHDTNVVRGLLCTRCNIGLGQFRDDPENLVNAARYLGAQVETVTWQPHIPGMREVA